VPKDAADEATADSEIPEPAAETDAASDSDAGVPKDAADEATADSEIPVPAAAEAGGDSDAGLPQDKAPIASGNSAATPDNVAAESEDTPQDDELNQ
jgi:hypothetical protein